MSVFWKHYEDAKPHVANIADDLRHNLVERPWYGREVTGDIAPWPRPEKQEPELGEGLKPKGLTPDEPLIPTEMKTDLTPHKHHDLYESIWGREPQSADIYGHGPVIDQTPAIEPPKGPQQGEGLGPGY